MDNTSQGSIMQPGRPRNGRHPWTRATLQVAAPPVALDEPQRAPDAPRTAESTVVHLGALFRPWTLELCDVLETWPRLRYNQVHAQLGDISTRTLTSRLDALRSAGIVERRLFDERPPRVEYSLTPAGRRFVGLLQDAVAGLQSSAGLGRAPK